MEPKTKKQKKETKVGEKLRDLPTKKDVKAGAGATPHIGPEPGGPGG